ncbi:RNA-binding protein [Galdieria sulphuraria]|uniref:RNA-binding protein n=1 Tax=Galdieria sulphuraria TaxID=130081 RepID=M2XVB3_GALSU|nr:RNA-binding protein [Galdieria sulphuraria]EME27334.1 RNA-binding protein [Galdieria sulphuraria]|eukprot:XP_005703854.1 RNA-binding protein [Galdieria sulphuraria]
MTDNTSTIIDTEAYLNQVLGLTSEKTSEKEDSLVNDNNAESSSKSCGEKDERKSSSSRRSTRRSQSPLKRHKRSRSRSPSSGDSSERRRRRRRRRRRSKSPRRRRYERDRSYSPRRRYSSRRESHSRPYSVREESKQPDEKRSRASSLDSSVNNDRSKQFRDPEEERKLKEREVDNSFPDYERDLRTIFVWQLAQKVTEKDVYNFFSAAGKVRDIRMIIDKRSGRHKGAAYVEFYYKEAIPSAMRLAGQQLCGYPVAIKPSEAEKNIAAEMAAREAAAAQQARLAELEEWSGGGDTSPNSNPLTFTKLYVGSIHFSISEDDLRTIFEPFGEVISLQLHKDPETGRSRGFGFVQYKNHEDAKKAFEQLNGLDLAGRPLKVGLATAEAQKLQVLGAIPSGVPGTIAAQSLSSKNYAYSAYISELDEGGDSGMALSATQRTQLMQRLARGEALASKSSPALGGKSPGLLSSEASPQSGTVPTRQGYNPPLVHSISPSTCLMLRNMFDPAQETDPNFHLEVQEDVRDECISKFGPLRHIFVDKNSAGLVYVQFETMSDAMKAKQGLHGRWFAGHQVIVEYISESVYYIRFPDLKKHSIQY